MLAFCGAGGARVRVRVQVRGHPPTHTALCLLPLGRKAPVFDYGGFEVVELTEVRRRHRRSCCEPSLANRSGVQQDWRGLPLRAANLLPWP